VVCHSTWRHDRYKYSCVTIIKACVTSASGVFVIPLQCADIYQSRARNATMSSTKEQMYPVLEDNTNAPRTTPPLDRSAQLNAISASTRPIRDMNRAATPVSLVQTGQTRPLIQIASMRLSRHDYSSSSSSSSNNNKHKHPKPVRLPNRLGQHQIML